MPLTPPIAAAFRRIPPWGAVLAAIVLAGAVFYFHGITKQCLWINEYWSLYLATGRGDAILHAPLGQPLNPPPPVGFHDAPAWPRIWMSMDWTTHPPFYYIVLRWWIDCFGDSDLAVRALSAVLSVASILLLFNVLRWQRKNAAGMPWPALLGAGLLAFSVQSIDYSQEARPYTMMVLLGLWASNALLRIEADGPTRLRLVSLGMAVLLLALTHYLDLGLIAGLGIYALIVFRGRQRRRVVVAIGAALLLFAIIWGPAILRQRSAISDYNDFRELQHPGLLAWHLLATPTILLFRDYNVSAIIILLVSLMVFVVPALTFRRNRANLFWWLWLAGSLSLVIGHDVWIANTSLQRLLAISRYLFLALPAVCALVSARLDRPWIVKPLVLLAALSLFPDAAWAIGNSHLDQRFLLEIQEIGLYRIMALCVIIVLIPSRFLAWTPQLLIIGCLAFALAARWDGAKQTNTEVARDWNVVAVSVERSLRADDVLAFCESSDYSDSWTYVVFQHYANDYRHPVIIGPDILPGAMSGHSSILIVTRFPKNAVAQLPGWTVEDISPAGGGNELVRMRR